MLIPEPLTGEARRDQLARERRERRGGLVGAAYELGTPSVQGGTGVLVVTPGLLRWMPDEVAVRAGLHAWELVPAQVREIEVTPSLRGAGIVRVVRVRHAIPVRLDVAPRAGLLDALRAAGFPTG